MEFRVRGKDSWCVSGGVWDSNRRDEDDDENEDGNEDEDEDEDEDELLCGLVQSRRYLSSVDSECFHYTGRWSLVISGTTNSPWLVI
ncbi:hypothetical protein M0802_014012 [Mischocyttarus mexicanus]|nr:hypothetical protein M0802_014017 [Mischocyttarus mexicanus]KAI4481248.1 hypothetical protein M0802_014012 [Mischocyttarus mexicanus]